MQYGPLRGFKGASTNKVPKDIFVRWEAILEAQGATVQDRLVQLIKQDVGQNWTEELERAFVAIYGPSSELSS